MEIPKNENKYSLISYDIICPECGEICRIKIDNYKIKFFGCKNGHEIEDITLEDYDNTQKIDMSRNKCNNCGNFNNKMFFCNKCNYNLCSECQGKHNNNHKLIDYHKKNFLCNQHYNQKYISYCKQCKQNLCANCEKEHDKKHEIILLKTITPRIYDIQKKMDELKKKKNLFENDINKIIDILTETKYNVNKYYNIYNNVLYNYYKTNLNYQLLQSIKDFDSKIIMNDLEKIINNNQINNKIKDLSDLYNKMNKKNEKNIIKFINADLKLDKCVNECHLINIDNITIRNISEKYFKKLYFVIDTKVSSKDFCFYHINKDLNKYTLLIDEELKAKKKKKQLIQLKINEPKINKVYQLCMYIRENEYSENLSPPFNITINLKEEQKEFPKRKDSDDDDIDYKGLSKEDIDETFNFFEEEYYITAFREEEEIKEVIIDLQCNKELINNWVESIM